jgi:transposase
MRCWGVARPADTGVTSNALPQGGQSAGPVRLLDLVDGRSATALASWLASAPASFAQGVKFIAMDGFAGYKTAATEASACR